MYYIGDFFFSWGAVAPKNHLLSDLFARVLIHSNDNLFFLFYFFLPFADRMMPAQSCAQLSQARNPDIAGNRLRLIRVRSLLLHEHNTEILNLIC